MHSIGIITNLFLFPILNPQSFESFILQLPCLFIIKLGHIFFIYVSYFHLSGLQIRFYFLQFFISISIASDVQVLVYFMVRFIDILTSNWAEVEVIWKQFFKAKILKKAPKKQAFAFLLLLKHGDAKINSEYKKKEERLFSFFHWNVNSISAYNKYWNLTILFIWNIFRLFCYSWKHYSFPSML